MATTPKIGGARSGVEFLHVSVPCQHAAANLPLKSTTSAFGQGVSICVAQLEIPDATDPDQLSRVRARYQTTVSLQLDLNCTPAEPPDLMREKGKLSDANLRAVECFAYARFQSGLDD